MNSRNYRERLIDEVKKYPVLYDTQHEHHRDIDVRDRCWLEISDRLGANSEVLKREWKILRDSMRQALKRSNTGATTKSGLPCKKWRFQSRMAFVLPYMTIRRNQRQIKENIKIDETEAASDDEREHEVWDPGNQLGNQLGNQPGNQLGNQPGPDHDSLDLFFASVCQSTKRLPRKYQSSVKRQVLDTLLRVEEEWENEQSESKVDVSKDYE
ncbi:transcription factor Adf-1-like isoform X2 [Trichoplusia ni]|nr:transcription factor Adf-1-like isoform X2 [Trichoplusia ni]